MSKSFVFAVAAFGLAVRLAFALGYWIDKPLTEDEREYLSLARSVTIGRGFTYDDALLARPVAPVGRAPGYPLFLALVGGGRQITEAVPVSVKIAQSVLGALGVVIIGVVAAGLAGPGAGRAAMIIAACYPPLVWISAYALSEILVWPIGLTLVWCFNRAVRATTRAAASGRVWTAFLVAGMVAGVAVLVHPAMLFFVLLAGAWLLWRRRLAPAIVFVIGVFLLVAPWTVRNYVRQGRVVLIASEGGVTFWTGNHPDARGEGDLAANPDLGRDKQALRAQHRDLSEEQMEGVYYRAAFTWMREHPLDWALLEGRKLFYLVVPIGPSYRLHSRLYYGASLVSYGVLLPLAIIGFFMLGARRARSPALWLLAASTIMVALAFFPQERFRIPVIDPVLVVCAAAVWGERRRL